MAAIDQKELPIVRKLYYEDLLSARLIGIKLGVSIHAVYHFLRKYKIKMRSLSENNAATFSRKPPSFCLKRNLTAKEKELKLLGIVLYWGEGYKAKGGSAVDFANSDPKMIFLFVRFLREICGIKEEKLRILLYCYSNQKIIDLIRFWGKLIKVPREQFTKPYVRSDYRPDKVGKMPHGLIHVRYGDKKLRNLIMKWIEDLTN